MSKINQPLPGTAKELAARQLAEWEQFKADQMLDEKHYAANTATVVISLYNRIKIAVDSLADEPATPTERQ